MKYNLHRNISPDIAS